MTLATGRMRFRKVPIGPFAVDCIQQEVIAGGTIEWYGTAVLSECQRNTVIINGMNIPDTIEIVVRDEEK